MTVVWNKIPLPFLGGIDTKTEAEALPPTRLSVLENGIFTRRGSIKKRNGYTALGNQTVAASPVSITEGRALAVLDDELLLFDSGKAYSYSEASDGWLDKGAIESVVTTQKTVANVVAQQKLADRATVSGVTLYAWEDSRSAVHFSIINETTGAVYASDQALPANTERPKCVAVGGKLFLFYVDDDAAELRLRIFNPVDIPGGLLASPRTIATDIDLAVPNPLYDVEAVGSLAYLAYCINSITPGSIGILKISSSGAVVTSTTKAANGFLEVLGIAVDPQTLQVAVFWGVVVYHIAYVIGNPPPAVDEYDGYVTFYDPNLVLLHTYSYFTDNANLDDHFKNITGAFQRDRVSGHPKLWIFVEHVHDPTKNYLNFVRRVAAADTIGIIEAAAIRHRHSGLASRPWRYGANVYVHLVHDSTQLSNDLSQIIHGGLQGTNFAVRQDGLIVTKELEGIAQGLTGKPHLPAVQDLGNGLFAWSPVFKRRLDTDVTITSGQSVDQNAKYTDDGIKAVTLDYANAQSHRSTKVGKALYVSGGYLWQYDGVSAVESGFHLFTENASFVASAVGSTKKYGYRIYFEWTNAKGEREQSTDSQVLLAQSANAIDATHTITLTLQTLAHTLKTSPRSEVSYAIYRTIENPDASSPFYRVSAVDPTKASPNQFVKNNPAVDTVAFLDEMTDADLQKQELDYQNTGELDNISPPAASIMVGGKGRIFLSGIEDPNQLIFSKLAFTDAGVAFNDTNIIQVDAFGGPITALAVLNEAFVVFKENQVFAFTGDGPNNLGNGGFGEPQLITSDAGCVNQRSITQTDEGIFFQSKKGIYLLNQQLQLSYIGAEVEAFNGQTITAGTRLTDSNQIRFLTSAGKTLLFDHLFAQWSTFTNHEGVDATIWKGTYVYLLPNGKVRKESTTNFRDENVAYRLSMTTAWIKLSELQGFQRVRSLMVLGEFKSAHSLRVQLAYDYAEDTFLNALIFNPSSVLNLNLYGTGIYGLPTGDLYGGSNGDSVYQFKASMPRQKCEALKVHFEDVPGTPPGESYQITELLLELGMKKTPFKIRDAKSIG